MQLTNQQTVESVEQVIGDSGPAVSPRRSHAEASAQRAAGRPAMQRRRAWRRRLTYHPTLSNDLIERFWTQPDSLIAEARMLKPGDRCTVVQLPAAPGAPGPMVLKRYNLRGPLHTARHWVLRSRARWSWLSGHRLRAAGLCSPLPLALLEFGFGPFNTRSYLLTEYISGSTLDEYVERHADDRAALEHVAREFAHIIQTLGEQRIGHGDMKATNFIVDDQRRLWLVDLDGMRWYPRGVAFARRHRRDCERFMRNWETQPELAAVFRAAFDTV